MIGVLGPALYNQLGLCKQGFGTRLIGPVFSRIIKLEF